MGGSLQAIDSITETNVTISASESKEEDLFEMWGVEDCLCIGYYHYDEENEVYVVDDLRKPNFDHIPYYPGDTEKRPIQITYPHEIRGIKLNDYYLFKWKLSHRNKFNPYEIYLDFKVQPNSIDPKWFIDTLFNDRHNDKSKNFGSATNFLDTLSKQLSAKESTFVYELLQNANDYPVEGKSVDVEFHITDNYLLFLHTGDNFNIRNISGICGINEKEKVANKKTIGYKGIGFKTVFLNNHYVYLRTGAYSFRFDEGETPEKKVGGKIKRLGAPFQILPIWTKHSEIAQEVNDIFDNSGDEFRVQIALRPDDKKLLHVGKNCYENLFKEVFSDSNIILFIPNINSVRVFINGTEERVCVRNNEEWVVGDYEEEVDIDLQESINKTIEKGNSRIPEKYKDFDCTKISFACKHEGAMIKSVEKATLYCYLPTKASWGFPFLMNSDMIPKGDRNDIETEVNLVDENETNFNEELAAIAGDKLFEWIHDLLTSKKYQLGTVFSLIPNFVKCKKEHDFYEDYIERFEEAFDIRVENDKIVPVSKGIANVKKVVLDTTGLSTSGIMTDEEFLKFTELEDYYLPLPILRKDKNFNAFFKRYADDEQKFEKENFSDLIANEDFQEWLNVQENNDKFLKFLLDNEFLEDLLDEEIFLKDEGGLFKASDLFYDIDEYKDDLKAFTNHICFLSPSTREFFKGNEDWNNVVDDAFATFNCDDFINDVLLSTKYIDETIEKLNDKETSIHFYKFLAENVVFSQAYKKLPYINADNDLVPSFDSDFIFVDNDEGKLQTKAKWLEDISFSFVSADYGEEVLNYFKKTNKEEGSDVSTPTFGVLDYDNLVLIEHIILNEKYVEKINTNQQKSDQAHKNFVSFCYTNKDVLPTGSLKSYALKVNETNKQGDLRFELTEANIFFKASFYDVALAHPWMGDDWMFSLSTDLLSTEISGDIGQLKKFYIDQFGVKDLSAQYFYDTIVCKNMEAIFKVTSKSIIEDTDKEELPEAELKAIEFAKKCNFDFVNYLDDNVTIVFKDNDYTKFNKLALIDSYEEFIANGSVTFFYHEELADLMSKAWVPSSVVNMCSKSYGESIALSKMQVNQNPRIKSYNFAEFYKLVIVPNLTAINQYLDSKTVNMDFHNTIISNIESLLLEDIKKMSNAKVFIQGKEQPVEVASSHQIVSKTVEELVALSLVDYGQFDLLDQDYLANKHTKYWETALGNKSFDITIFQKWLKDHKESIVTKLQYVNLNIRFWRWAKKNVKENISCFSGLPILLKGNNVPLVTSGEVYFSDAYLDAPIENLVTTVAPNAHILAPDYIENNEEKKEWVDFWAQLNIQQNEVEVLENVVKNHLSVTNIPSLPELIFKNRAALEEKFNNDLISFLAEIQLFGADNQPRPAKECVFVLCTDNEPFAYINIPNRVSSLQPNINSLIGEIIQKHNPTHYVTDLTKWRQEKIESYLMLQNANQQGSVHAALIKDLAVLINTNRDNLTVLPKVCNIYLQNREHVYKPCENLTEGSKYDPFFDFESCNNTLDYIDDSYLSCGASVSRIFDFMKVHHNLEERDLSKLSDYRTACYFWRDYLGAKNIDARNKNIKHVQAFITSTKNPFKDLICVPVFGDKVVTAESLYSLHIQDKVKLLPNSEKLLPLDLVSLAVLIDEKSASKEKMYFMDKLAFKMMLDVQSCFDALCNIPADLQPSKEKELRKELVKWIVYQKNAASSSLAEYRANDNALWNNGISQKQQIAELYALNPKDNIEQYFGNNAKVIDASYVANKDNQMEAFEALNIKVISKTDVDTVPSADKRLAPDSNRIRTNLKFYTLILSGIDSLDSWKSSYEEYCDKVEKMSFWQCSAIEKKYKYDEKVVKKLSGFYHEEGKDDFYFKGDLESKLVFLDYVNAIKKYLDIKVDIEIVKRVMDSRQAACDLVECEYGLLLLDDEFVEEVRKTMPRFNKKIVVEPMKSHPTKPVEPHPTTQEFHYPQKEEVQTAPKPDYAQEDSNETVSLSKADVNALSEQQKIDAQLEAQKYLLSTKPMWTFPENFAEVDEEGKPYCYSTFNIIDEEENNCAIVLKSYKCDKAPFSINPNEWDYIIKNKAKLLIYRGDDIIEIQKEDLVRNQNSIVLRFSTENLNIEDRISEFSDLLHYFGQINFDFESFNVPKRAKSILAITNKNEGTQTGGSKNDI